MATFALFQFARCSLEYDLSTTITSLGSEINDPVGTLDHVHIVFDDYYRVSALDQSIESGEQFIDVVEMQTRSRLVEDEHHSPCRVFAQHIRR